VKRKDFKKIIAKLKRKFQLIEDSTDHYSYEIYYNQNLITYIKSSHTLKDSHDVLIARNLHISKTQLKRYIACSFTNENLIEKMKERRIWREK
jgi:hypothetical protein